MRNDYANGIDSSGGATTSLGSLNQLLTLHALPGYDDVTGLGSPRVAALIASRALGARH